MSNPESPRYYRAAKFTNPRLAEATYFGLQKLIDRPDADLSVYRIQILGEWYVVAVGAFPSRELADELQRILSTGESVDIPSQVLNFLWQRREEQIESGPWVEGHYRPGLAFRFRRNEAMPHQLFPLGRIMMTTNLKDTLQRANPAGWEEELQMFINRHASGDWGDLDEEDKLENELSLHRGSRILSAHIATPDIRVWVITEADRSITTVLLPEDY